MTGIIAITGAIGCGKSTASQIFASFGVPIIDADTIARELVFPDQPAFEQIVNRWGFEVVKENGDLNRRHLREIIFNNPEDKLWLENLLHPAIFDKIKQRIKEVEYPYCIVVIPLLAQDYPRYQPLIDHVILMDAPEEQQFARLALRDDHSPALLQKMIDAQKKHASERLKIADTVLYNDGNLPDLKNKIKDLHQSFLALYTPPKMV